MDLVLYLCPGQGAQKVGMGKAWAEAGSAREVFDEADSMLGETLGTSLSEICFTGPPERLNRTDVAQPALFTAALASHRGLEPSLGSSTMVAAAGLSLGEYTALHLAGVFDFETGLKLVALRGQFMQEAAMASDGGMVALIGGDEAAAHSLCEAAAGDEILVLANFNAPGQIVLSGTRSACDRAVAMAGDHGVAARPLDVAGAFHSPLMQTAADRLGEALASVHLNPPTATVWSNVTAEPHETDNLELLRRRLVEQIVSPVRWAETCEKLEAVASPGATIAYHELAPGAVLRSLMRRIDRQKKVITHDQPDEPFEQQ